MTIIRVTIETIPDHQHDHVDFETNSFKRAVDRMVRHRKESVGEKLGVDYRIIKLERPEITGGAF